MSSAGMVLMLGCSQVWLPTSMPASAIRLAAPGSRATLFPIRKKVALASLSTRTFRSRSVNGVGPSSKVNATHSARAQSTSSAPTWWRSAATVTTAAVAPITAINARPDIHHDLLIFGAISPPFHPHQLDASYLDPYPGGVWF